MFTLKETLFIWLHFLGKLQLIKNVFLLVYILSYWVSINLFKAEILAYWLSNCPFPNHVI